MDFAVDNSFGGVVERLCRDWVNVERRVLLVSLLRHSLDVAHETTLLELRRNSFDVGR